MTASSVIREIIPSVPEPDCQRTNMKFPFVLRSRFEKEMNEARKLKAELEKLQQPVPPPAPRHDASSEYQPGLFQTDTSLVLIEETWSDDMGVGMRGFVLVKQGVPQDMEITLAGQPPFLFEWEDRADLSGHDCFAAYPKHVKCGFKAVFRRRAHHDVSITFPSSVEGPIQRLDLPATGYAPLPKMEPEGSEPNDFFDRVNRECHSVLEIGSRIVSPGSKSKRGYFAPHVKYTGFDIYPDANTDVVGDAHELSRYFPKDTKFDAIFSLVVLEHTAMPWKIAMEINRLLPIGGLSYHCTPFTFPLHESPWDFWRFTHEGLRMLFSPALGFEILSLGLSGPCRVHMEEHLAIQSNAPHHPSFARSKILVRKVRDYSPDDFRWNTSLHDVLPPDSAYPNPLK